MIIAVTASDQQWEELVKPGDAGSLERISLRGSQVENAGAFLLLDPATKITELTINGRPVLLNSVTNTLADLGLPSNFTRINGWNGFLGRPKWEIAGDITEPIKSVAAIFRKQLIPVADIEGLVAARVVCMIINEAYFALGEHISTKAAIDLAMKLGTNYPYGPFEWSAIIGLSNVFQLLEKLSRKDSRYIPAPLLKLEAGN